MDIPRSMLLKGGAVAAGAATLGAVGAAQLADPPRADALGVRPNPHYRRPKVTRLKTVTGPDETTDYAMEATDLGIPATTPDGRILTIFGDTFEGPKVGSGDWRSPVGLYADPRRPLGTGVRWTGAVGSEDHADQLVDYDHEGEISTYLPGDVLTLGDTMYLWVMANAGFGNVVRTEIWTSKDSGESWKRTQKMFDGDHLDGLCQQATWCEDPDGKHVVLLTTGFQRDKGAILQRVPKDELLDPDAYETYGPTSDEDDADWDWGKDPEPVIGGSVGEMCLRVVEDHVVLTYFNAGLYRIDCLIAETPTGLREGPFAETLLWGCEWGHEDDERVAQLYGGYIVPGSTLREMHLLVSQWHTGPDWPYHVEQFRIRGLDRALRA
jgi:hypothetical protein